MSDTIDWLMAGDPALRWQALRDLLDAPRQEWESEQRRTVEAGWGGGIYAPKWTSATYTLLMLRLAASWPTATAASWA